MNPRVHQQQVGLALTNDLVRDVNVLVLVGLFIAINPRMRCAVTGGHWVPDRELRGNPFDVPAPEHIPAYCAY